MKSAPGEKLRELRKLRGISAYALADAANTTHQQIYLLEHGKRELSRKWAERLAPHLGVSPKELLFPEDETPPKVPVFGYAEGGIVEIVSGGISPQENIELPRIFDRYAAVIVRGDAMRPAYCPGDILLFTPPDVRTYAVNDLVGRDCVVRLDDGRTFVRLIRKGRQSGRVDLVSHNHAVDPIYDARIMWGAPVEWVKKN